MTREKPKESSTSASSASSFKYTFLREAAKNLYLMARPLRPYFPRPLKLRSHIFFMLKLFFCGFPNPGPFCLQRLDKDPIFFSSKLESGFIAVSGFGFYSEPGPVFFWSLSPNPVIFAA